MNTYRHEYKYIIDPIELTNLKVYATGTLSLDHYANAEGFYNIRSLYFDDIFDTCFNENEAGTDPRSKFRVRYYNEDVSRISLEKKSKYRGMTLKESCFLSEKEYFSLINGNQIELKENDPPNKKSLLTELYLRQLHPKVIVTYKRTPYVYPAGNVRITFDEDITSSNDLNNFLSGTYIQRPILNTKSSILEVKWDEFLPEHLFQVLQLDTLQWTAFSKYYMCRLHHI